MDTKCEDDPRRLEYEKLTRRKPAPGTRVYREDGHWMAFEYWLLDMRTMFEGDVIPFEWVAQYVGVTRAAVHKKVKAGQLTVYTFAIHEYVRGALGGTRKRMRQEFKYALLTECCFWREKLLEEAAAVADAESLARQAREEKERAKFEADRLKWFK